MVFYTHSLSSFQKSKPQYQLKQLFLWGVIIWPTWKLALFWIFPARYWKILVPFFLSNIAGHEMKGMNLFSGINHPRSRWLQLVRIVSINFPIRPPCIRGYSRRATVAAFKAKETPLLLQHSRDEQLLTNGCPFCHCRIFLPNTQRIVSLQSPMSWIHFWRITG